MQLATSRGAEFLLLSDVPGRQRWLVPALESRPRLAAAVEIALRKESKASRVKANPLTGRILIQWDPSQTPGCQIDHSAGARGRADQRSGFRKAARGAGRQSAQAAQSAVSGRLQALINLRQPDDLGSGVSRASRRSDSGDVRFGGRDYRIRFSASRVQNSHRTQQDHDRHSDWSGNSFQHRA